MHDAFGNPVTVTSAAAQTAYDRAVDLHLHAWPGVAQALQAALALAPGFALAHAALALWHGTWGRGAAARESLAQARSHTAGTTPREGSQLSIVAAIVEGRAADALQQVLEHTRLYPTDALAASTAMGAYGLLAFSGRADHNEARYDLLEGLAGHFPEELPWLLSNRGWARIELGRVDEGLAMAQRAIAIRPQNGHNAHIVMHGLHEGGDAHGVLDFAAAWLPGYDDSALLWGHLQWHAALAELALGSEDAAVARLLGPIVSYLGRGTPFMGLADIASLLWRLGLRRLPALPWAEAHAHAGAHFPNGSNVFGELHLAMIAAARRDAGSLTAVQERLRAVAQRGHAGAPVALDWAAALQALVKGDVGAAQVALATCQRSLARLGGSHAQRGVVDETVAAPRLPAA